MVRMLQEHSTVFLGPWVFRRIEATSKDGALLASLDLSSHGYNTVQSILGLISGIYVERAKKMRKRKQRMEKEASQSNDCGTGSIDSASSPPQRDAASTHTLTYHTTTAFAELCLSLRLSLRVSKVPRASQSLPNQRTSPQSSVKLSLIRGLISQRPCFINHNSQLPSTSSSLRTIRFRLAFHFGQLLFEILNLQCIMSSMNSERS